MTVRVSKPAFNLREALNALRKKMGLKGAELLKADTAADVYTAINPIMFRNKLINGDMRFDARNNGSLSSPSNTGSFYKGLDRWRLDASLASKFTVQRQTISNTPLVGGNTYCMMLQSSAATTLSSGDYFGFNQFVEADNVGDLLWGTSAAKPVTLSFYVFCTLTGVFSGAIRTGDSANLSYPFTYTINTPNTWQYVTITIPGPTSGTWAITGNGRGLDLWFSIGTGSVFKGPAGSWSAANYVAANGETALVNTSGASIWFTGIQLEKGTVATPFEFRQYGAEQALCERYYLKRGLSNNVTLGVGTVISGGTSFVHLQFPVPMRASPTISQSSTYIYEPASSTVSSLGTIYTNANNDSVGVNINHATGLTTGRAAVWLCAGAGYVEVDAEL